MLRRLRLPAEARHAHRGAPGDEGAAAVEFALLVPVLLIVVFGIIAFGLTLFAQISAVHGAREAARLASVGVGPGLPTTSCSAWQTAAVDRATGSSAVQPKFTITDDNGDGQVGPGDKITVTFSYSSSSVANGALSGATALIPGASLLLPSQFTATAISRAEVVGATSCG